MDIVLNDADNQADFEDYDIFDESCNEHVTINKPYINRIVKVLGQNTDSSRNMRQVDKSELATIVLKMRSTLRELAGVIKEVQEQL
jgi:hypothetical protein